MESKKGVALERNPFALASGLLRVFKGYDQGLVPLALDEDGRGGVGLGKEFHLRIPLRPP